MRDVVYPLKRQSRSDELRYSLRSLKNLPHRQVWLSGFRPYWAHNARFIRGERKPNKYEDALGNIIRACEEPDLTDEFILMNDDFYILSQQEDVRVFHRGELGAFIDRFPHQSEYRKMMLATLGLLKSEGIAEPLFYGTHTPTVMAKRRVLEIVRRFEGQRFMLRTVYHNLFGPEGTFREDVKKQPGSKLTESDYLSSSDAYAKGLEFDRLMRRLFPYPCYYEVTTL